MARRLGHGDHDGAICDDGSDLWEDIEYESEDDAEFEAIWRENERVNDENEQRSGTTKRAHSVHKNFAMVRNLFSD